MFRVLLFRGRVDKETMMGEGGEKAAGLGKRKGDGKWF